MFRESIKTEEIHESSEIKDKMKLRGLKVVDLSLYINRHQVRFTCRIIFSQLCVASTDETLKNSMSFVRCFARDVSRVSSLLRDVSRLKIRDKDRFARHFVCKCERVNDAKRCGTCKEHKQLSFICLLHGTTYSIMNIGKTYTQDTTTV